MRATYIICLKFQQHIFKEEQESSTSSHLFCQLGRSFVTALPLSGGLGQVEKNHLHVTVVLSPTCAYQGEMRKEVVEAGDFNVQSLTMSSCLRSVKVVKEE